MLLNDIQIEKLASDGMITPFESKLVRESENRRLVSYGLSSYGYDIRLSSNDFRVFKHIPGTVVNPKNFNPDNLESVESQRDEYGEYFVIPANSYALGVAIEKLNIPNNISVICMGKSTYARVGIIANVTPAEAGWVGHLTLEFSNSSSADCRIYANEGVVQLLFFQGESCGVSYSDRKGKYQNQTETITIAKV